MPHLGARAGCLSAGIIGRPRPALKQQAIEALFVDLFVEAHRRAPRQRIFMGGPNGTHPGRVVEYDQPPSPRTPSRGSPAAARKELGHLNFEPVPVISKAQIIAPAGRRRLTQLQLLLFAPPGAEPIY